MNVVASIPLVALATAIGIGLVEVRVPALVLVNTTPSEPMGLYLQTHRPASKQAIVAIRPQAIALHFLARSGHHPTSLLKSVAAAGGDHVCTRGGVLVINGRQLAPIVAATPNGIPLPHWVDCRVLGADELFVFSDRVPNSFDSRYYGPVRRRDVIGVYRPLWTEPFP